MHSLVPGEIFQQQIGKEPSSDGAEVNSICHIEVFADGIAAHRRQNIDVVQFSFLADLSIDGIESVDECIFAIKMDFGFRVGLGIS